MALINRASFEKILTFNEHHHIIPKCIGGTDTDDNIVALSSEEHFVAHRLLTKIFPESLALKKVYYLMAFGPYLSIGTNKHI